MPQKEIDSIGENTALEMKAVRAVPYYRNGQIIGIRLFAVEPESIFARIGFKNGDILQVYQGKYLALAEEFWPIIQDLKEQGKVSITLERNRKQMVLDISAN